MKFKLSWTARRILMSKSTNVVFFFLFRVFSAFKKNNTVFLFQLSGDSNKCLLVYLYAKCMLK